MIIQFAKGSPNTGLTDATIMVHSTAYSDATVLEEIHFKCFRETNPLSYHLLIYHLEKFHCQLLLYRTETSSQYAIIKLFAFSVLETSSILPLRNVVHSSQIICLVLSLTLFKLGEGWKENLNFVQLFIKLLQEKKATSIC